MKKNIFCPSPWFHIKIDIRGWYVPCRWMILRNVALTNSIENISMKEYFNSAQMKELRVDMLNDTETAACSACYYEDSFDKISGRQIQLNKSQINYKTIDQDIINSPQAGHFRYSEDHAGETNLLPVDLQINLSDVCNSACLMCSPRLSTRLMQDYRKLPDSVPIIFNLNTTKPWVDDPVLLDKFVKELSEMPNIEYLHLLGGETLYLKSFYKICDALIEADVSKNISLGTTTNLTIDPEVLDSYIDKFQRFHIGLSIESINPLNDYIRYPSGIGEVTSNLRKFLALRPNNPNLHMSLRITPSLFSIFCIDEMVQFMCDNDIIAESCNILTSPPFLRMELLPDDLRRMVINKLLTVIKKNKLVRESVNTGDKRNSKYSRSFISNVAYSYLDFLNQMTPPDDLEQSRTNLVAFIKGFESIRHNSILEHLPEYENFLRQYGY